MFYVKEPISDTMEITIEINDENVFCRCPVCGKVHAIFGESHADDIAKAHGISPVCRLPINPKLAAAVDAGMIELMDENGLDALADKLAGLLR